MEILNNAPVVEYVVILLIGSTAFLFLNSKMEIGFGPYNMKVFGITLKALKPLGFYFFL